MTALGTETPSAFTESAGSAAPAPELSDRHRVVLSGPAAAVTRPRPGRRAPVYVTVGILVTCGIVLRAWLLWHSPLNADEANAGLMAMSILHGHTYTFFWGGNYGGLEPYAAAPLVWLFGPNPVALNLTPTLLYGATCIVVWRIGRRTLGPSAAAVAAGVAWVWPEPTAWLSTRESGFRQAAILLGALVLLFGCRIRDRGDAPLRRDWLGIGAFTGLGWWGSPEVAYFVVPALAVTAGPLYRLIRSRDPRAWASLALGQAALVVGALPWIYTNIHTKFASLHQPGAAGSYWSRFEAFWTGALPLLAGFRVEGGGQWVVSSRLGITLYWLMLATVGLGAVLLWRSRPSSRLIIGGLVLFPFLYATFPPNGFWRDGRYASPVTPFLVLVVVGAGWELAVRLAHVRRELGQAGFGLLGGAAVCGVLLPFNLADGGALTSWSALTSFHRDANGPSRQVAADLEALGVRSAYASYWISYDVMFLSGQKVVMTEIDDIRSVGAWNAVNASADPAWVFPNPSLTPEVVDQFGVSDFGYPEWALVGYLQRNGIPYSARQVGLVDVIQPSRKVTAADVGARPVFTWDPVG